MRRDLLPLLSSCLLALTLAGLTGCVEVEERLILGSEAGGTYELRLAWDAELLVRVNDVVGWRVARRYARGALPLDAASWRESLAGRPGLVAERVEVEEGLDGWRVLHVRVAFERLEDLLGWEVFARRDVELALRRGARADAGGEGGADAEDGDRARGGDTATLVMRPLGRVAPLARLRGALALWRRPPERSSSGGLREPSLAERLGILPADGDLLADVLGAQLDAAAFTFRVEVPGALLEAPRGEVVDGVATWRLGTEPDGTVELRWRPRAEDRVPRLRHPSREGAAAPARSGR